MLRRSKAIEDCEIRARDGVIGHVTDLYFDDEHWHVRYFVVNTGSWLTDRRVLISAASASQVGDGERRALAVNLTTEQVRNSPGIDTDKPVSRQHEEQLHQHYAWPYYWVGPFVGGGIAPLWAMASPTAAASPADSSLARPAPGEPRRDSGSESTKQSESRHDPHLRSVTAVRNYSIAGTDGDIGHVEDFLIDESSWAISFLLVDTRNWWPGKNVLISPQRIREINWSESKVSIDLPRDTIKSSPEYDAAHPPTPEYTDRLEAHYGRARQG